MEEIKGQISVWDIEVPKIKVPDINTENNSTFTEIIDKNVLNKYINEADKIIEIGDTVKVEYNGKKYIGKVKSIYGVNNCTLNIIFNNMHTAFYKNNVQLV